MRLWLPAALLALGVAGALVLLLARPQALPKAPEETAPFVRVTPVELREVRLVVRSQGTVRARTESDLVPEVSGRVSWVSPALREGSFFEAGEVLLRIEPRAHRAALRSARAAAERRESEHALAKQTLARREQLHALGVASPAELDDRRARERVAQAAAREALAHLEQAELALARTELLAPFAGRVLEKRIDLGQFASRGVPVARAYAIDTAEIRLPIPDDELAFLDLPLDYRGETREVEGPSVLLRGEFAGGRHEWTGRIVRSEGQLDPRTRLVHVVAEVEDPYARGEDPSRPPLPIGLFVEAEIQGKLAPRVAVLPRAALRRGGRALVLDDESRLRFRELDILRIEGERVLVTGGLERGERVCTSPLEAPVGGMRARAFVEAGPPLPLPSVAGGPPKGNSRP
jgi:RND family efflux transporter MFP subunit